MAIKRWADLKKQSKLSTERLAEIEAAADQEVLEMDLRQLRDALGLTQAEVAAAAEMTQGDYSKAERRDDWRVSTLRRVAKALGGELKLVVSLGGRDVTLAGG